MFLMLFYLLTIIGSLFLNRFSQAQDQDVLSEFREKILNAHNEYRRRHHSPPLQLKEELNDVAQRYSETLATIGKLQHSGGPYGENLYAVYGVSVSNVMDTQKTNPVREWYSEISYYPDYQFYKWGHFTQVIWKSSKYLGCGMSGKDRNVYVVCNYEPPGNVMGQYERNVLTIHGSPWPTGPSFWSYVIVLGIIACAIAFGVFVVYGRRGN